MTGAQNRLIHELVEQSRDRVAHVRAGQSLVEVLDHQDAQAAAVRSNPLAAAFPSTCLKFRRQDAPVSNAISDASGQRIQLRKRAAVVASVQQPFAQSTVAASSYDQYASYAGSKLTQQDAVNTDNRRKAIATSTKQMAQLAANVTMKEAAAAKSDSDTTAALLMRTMAVMKSKQTFLKVKTKTLPPPRVQETAKNTHMAFLEFKHESPTGSRSRKHRDTGAAAAAAADTRKINATTREPLRFGDAVCFLSLVADVPLAINRNGRTLAVDDSSTGPHMTFTIVDFENPSRRDDVLIGEDFWLRVDATYLDLAAEDEIVALLVDTQYYLGCPGWLEDGVDDESHHHHQHGNGWSTTSFPAITHGSKKSAHKYVKRIQVVDDTRLLKLVAMKASVPSTDYYGDDRATREYALETNQNIMRLAKWRLADAAAAKLHGNADAGSTTTGTDTERALVLNCSAVWLMQGEFPLEFEPQRRRGVVLGSLKHATGSGSSGTEHHGHYVHQRQQQPHRSHNETCAWQVRLLHREKSKRDEDKTDVEMDVEQQHHNNSEGTRDAPPLKNQRRQLPTEKESLEWLAFHQGKVAQNARRIQDKHKLAHHARQAYDKVAAQSNAKLAQIETHKAMNSREYFESRFKTVTAAAATTHLPIL